MRNFNAARPVVSARIEAKPGGSVARSAIERQVTYCGADVAARVRQLRRSIWQPMPDRAAPSVIEEAGILFAPR